MNAETGKSSSLSPFPLLGLPMPPSRWGNHKEKENVSLLPICTCKQNANHATSLCILKRRGCLVARLGLPPRRRDEGSAVSPECRRCVCRPCPATAALDFSSFPQGACPSASEPGPGQRPACTGSPAAPDRVLPAEPVFHRAGWHRPPPGGDTCPSALRCSEGTGTSRCLPPNLSPSRRRVLVQRLPPLFSTAEFAAGSSGGEVLGSTASLP